MEEEQGFEWKAVIGASLLILVLSLVVHFAIVGGYPTYQGFMSRGDPAQIQQASILAATSPVFMVIVYAIIALLAFWRGRVIGKSVEYRPEWHAAIAALLGVLVVDVFNLLNSHSILLVLVLHLVAIGAAYAGAVLGGKQARPA